MSATEPRYFVMQSRLVERPARVRAVTDLGRPPWQTGARLDYEVPEPIEYEVRAGNPGALLPFYNLRYPMLRRDLVDALRASGVDNLEVYEAVLRDANSGEVHRDYHAVNVVGVASVADPERSVRSDASDSILIDGSFESLAVSPDAAGGLLMFRLAESVNAIIAHAHVRSVVEPRVPGIEFLEPSEWSG